MQCALYPYIHMYVCISVLQAHTYTQTHTHVHIDVAIGSLSWHTQTRAPIRTHKTHRHQRRVHKLPGPVFPARSRRQTHRNGAAPAHLLRRRLLRPPADLRTREAFPVFLLRNQHQEITCKKMWPVVCALNILVHHFICANSSRDGRKRATERD